MVNLGVGKTALAFKHLDQTATIESIAGSDSHHQTRFTLSIDIYRTNLWIVALAEFVIERQAQQRTQNNIGRITLQQLFGHRCALGIGFALYDAIEVVFDFVAFDGNDIGRRGKSFEFDIGVNIPTQKTKLTHL